MKKMVGERLKKARSALELTQKELCALIEKPLPSLRDYELGKSIPGGDAVAALIRAGINANWLLTGEGPMMLADLAPPPLLNKLNVDALEAIFEGSFIAAPRMPPEERAALCASIYKGSIDRGEITPDGIGTGGPNSQAA